MQKVRLLRETLLASGLGLQPEDIIARVKQGAIRHHYRHPEQGRNRKIRLEYSAELFVCDYHLPPEALFELVCAWLSQHEPGHGAESLRFEAEILDHEKVDVLITISGLTDVYHSIEQTDGVQVMHCPAEVLSC